MNTLKCLFGFGFAFTITLMSTVSLQAQGCGTCGQASGAVFGYPGGGCGPGGAGGCLAAHRAEFQARKEHYKQVNEIVSARNNAFPKPFACQDRTVYENVWGPMLREGIERQCLLTSAHFNAETNELNDYGIQHVASIMANMPVSERQVYVNQSSDQYADQARLASTQRMLATYYPNSPGAVAMTSKTPTTLRSEGYLLRQTLRETALQPAVLPVSLGQAVSDSASSGN